MRARDANPAGGEGVVRGRGWEPAWAGGPGQPAGASTGGWRAQARRPAPRRAPLTFDAEGRVEAGAGDPWLRLSRRLTEWLESSFQVPGTRLRFGWEPVIGLVPGVGDLVGAALSSVLLWTAHRLGVPRIVQARMLVNVVVDTGIGAIPVLGDLYDFFFRSNRRNLTLLERALGEPERPGRASDWAYVGAAVAGAVLLLLGLAALAVSLLGAALAALL
jgi:hypothetical protein